MRESCNSFYLSYDIRLFTAPKNAKNLHAYQVVVPWKTSSSSSPSTRRMVGSVRSQCNKITKDPAVKNEKLPVSEDRCQEDDLLLRKSLLLLG
uniref:Uncharacterized protein n=1 Tax=Ditylenchus dipsaci TaxID=166011 RepID=A0A915E176_9BILA